MACPEAVVSQEKKYLKALQAANCFEWKDPYLLLYCKGFDKPGLPHKCRGVERR